MARSYGKLLQKTPEDKKLEKHGVYTYFTSPVVSCEVEYMLILYEVRNTENNLLHCRVLLYRVNHQSIVQFYGQLFPL